MSGKIVVGYWDCSYCNTTGINGLERTCPNCGCPVSKDVKYYLKPRKKTYLDPETAKDYGKSPNWVCAYCGGYNRYNSSVCENCGANKGSSEENYFGKKLHQSVDSFDTSMKEDTYRESELSLSSYYEDDSSDNSSDDSDQYYSNSHEKTFTNNCPKNYLKKLNDVLHLINPKVLLISLGGFVALISIIMLLISVFTPKVYNAQITNKTWYRSISIEELRTIEESDWYVPNGARVYFYQDEIRRYDQKIDHYETISYGVEKEVFDHYEYEYVDNGDGTFTEISIPIYKTVYETVYEDVPVYVDVPDYDTKYYY